MKNQDGREENHTKRWDDKYPQGICAGCNRPKKIVNSIFNLCDNCNHDRKRRAARQEAEAESPTHELSAKARKALCNKRTNWCQYLNLMDKLGFSYDAKRACKQLGRPFIQGMIERDLTEDGEFDLDPDAEDAGRMEDSLENACPPSSKEERELDAQQNVMHALLELGIPEGATHATVHFQGETFESISWGFPSPEPLPPNNSSGGRMEDKIEHPCPPSSNAENEPPNVEQNPDHHDNAPEPTLTLIQPMAPIVVPTPLVQIAPAVDPSVIEVPPPAFWRKSPYATCDIEHTDHKFNLWEGCVKISPGCKHCYASALNRRHLHGPEDNWGADAPRRMQSERYWLEPLKWNRRAARTGIRERVMAGTMCDVMERRDDLDAPRQRLYKLIEETPNLTWMFFTKRPEEYKNFLLESWRENPRPNVWLLATVENQDYVWRIDELMKVSAVVYGLSIEPMLGPVTLPEKFLALRQRAWVIAGGESGHHARPARIEWFRQLRDTCVAAGVPFFFKQWGAHGPDLVRMKAKKQAGRLLDGREWNGCPSAA